MPRQLRDHAHGSRSAVREREQRGEAHVLGSHNERPRAGTHPLEVDELLERGGRHHALGTRTRHEPSRARTLATAGGEHDRGGLQLLAPLRAREFERPAGSPARDHRLGAQLGARGRRELGVAARVARPGERTAKVAQAEALVLGMTRDPAGHRLPLEHEHVGHAAAPQLERRGQPGGTGPDDHDRPGAHRLPSSSSASSAPQKKPWQRPMCARVRRRRPSRSTAGSGPSSASLISPRVTRSQKQTILP